MNSVGNLLVIGTYTEKLAHVDGHAAGILTATFEHGVLGEPVLQAVVANPSWLTVTRDGRFAYAVIETVTFENQPGGGVAAYVRDPDTGTLTLLNRVASHGVEPAHLEVDPSGRFVLVANYRTGSISVFEREADGRLGKRTGFVQHAGSSVHPVRQTGPHAHQVVFDPVTNDMVVPDLGLDAVLFYRLGQDGSLTERPEARIRTAPGAGPRHLAFHPDGKHLLLLNELDNTLMVLRRTGDHFEQTDLVSTLPPDFKGHNQTSALRVSFSGGYVFASNRGYDSIAVLAFDGTASKVELKLVQPTGGREPRDFIQTPDGRYLIVGNQDSDTIVTFAFDETAPSLTFVSQTSVPTPVCLLFA